MKYIQSLIISGTINNEDEDINVISRSKDDVNLYVQYYCVDFLRIVNNVVSMM